MSGLQVFQDLVLTGSEDQRQALSAALEKVVTPHWLFDESASKEAVDNGLGEAGVLIFEHKASPSLPAARLVLWPQESGYYVPNVTPVTVGSLTIGEYNALLLNFSRLVAEPVARRYGFTVTLTAANQSLEDWLAPEPAAALRQFSAAANKTTGTAHPMDERRWFDFIIAVHRAGSPMDAGRLSRWLNEVEGWDENTAHELAGEFERGISLLSREVETR